MNGVIEFYYYVMFLHMDTVHGNLRREIHIDQMTCRHLCGKSGNKVLILAGLTMATSCVMRETTSCWFYRTSYCGIHDVNLERRKKYINTAVSNIESV